MIRRATSRDVALIAAVEDAASPAPWSADQVAASLALSTTAAWVVDADGVVAHLLVSAQADEGEVLILAVHPARRRRGHAGALLDAADAWWQARGVDTAWLEVRADNAPARALYASRDWIPAGRRPRYYPDGTDALVLKREPWGGPEANRNHQRRSKTP